METIQLKIERITYANQETGYVVLRGMLKNRQITAVGIIPEVVTGANLTGIEYQFGAAGSEANTATSSFLTSPRYLPIVFFIFLPRW